MNQRQCYQELQNHFDHVRSTSAQRGAPELPMKHAWPKHLPDKPRLLAGLRVPILNFTGSYMCHAVHSGDAWCRSGALGVGTSDEGLQGDCQTRTPTTKPTHAHPRPPTPSRVTSERHTHRRDATNQLGAMQWIIATPVAEIEVCKPT